MNETKRALSAVALPDGIYIFGGYNGLEYVPSVQKLDLTTYTWQDLKPMNTARGTFSALSSNNYSHIFVIGGFNGQPLDHVERYDLIS